MKRALFIILPVFLLTACDPLGLKDEKWTHQVENLQKDDYFIIENKSQPTFVRFSIEGELNQDARILWSDTAPDADTLFKYANEILLPKGEINLSDIRGDYYSRKLYVKYVPSADSTSGKLLIKIKIS